MAPPSAPSQPGPSDPDAPPLRGWRGWAQRRKHWLLLTCGLLALVAVMTLNQPLPRVDRMLQDSARAVIAHPATDQIVIVAIDDKTLAAIGRFPWRRGLHAELLRRISAQGPRCIGLDILMSEPDADHRGDDAVLADAMLDSGCVVLPMALQNGAGEAQRELLPVPPLAAAAAAIGHAHISVDEDGVVRSVYLREGFRGRLWPHF
jgi:CHASE2 domain-containing sensor protein